MTTPIWVDKLLHALIEFMRARGVRMTPADIDKLRELLRRSIGMHTEPPSDDAPTDPAPPL